jgi:pyruvate dehydrogenase E2 component (dihydrolipoamide acetyltransferase)
VDDVKAYAQALRSALPPTPLAAQPVEPPDFTRWGEVERLPFTNVRRVTARRVAAAWNAVPHVTQYDKADITWWEVARKQHGPRVERAGGKLTVTALLLRVIAAALRLFPKFNASLDLSREEVILKRYCHIGVAVDTERGLLAPVIRNVDHKNVTELSVELTAVSERARAGKLTLEEMQGGCFTISNLGGIGGDAFSPIVNWPEVAILGVSRAAPAPVLLDGQFVPRHLLPLSLSYDHRLIDGADGARFLRWVSEALADPFLLLLEG